MRLDRIIKNSNAEIIKGNACVEVDSICCDSRKVTPGALFIAIKGFTNDGHEYIPLAISKGARVIA